MTTIRKLDGTETTSLHETANVIFDCRFTDDSGEDNLHHKNIRKATVEPIQTDDDAEFTQEEKKNTIQLQSEESTWTRWHHRRNLSPNVPRIIATIYNQCLKRGCSPKRWRIAKVIRVTKPAKENSLETSKYRPISLLNIGGNVLDKLLISTLRTGSFKLFKRPFPRFKQYKSTSVLCLFKNL
jgi:hypothetical protein